VKIVRRSTPTIGRGLYVGTLDLEEVVEDVLAEVQFEGDDAVLRYTRQFDGVELPVERLRVAPQELSAALDALDPAVREALELAIANVRAVVEAQLREPVAIELAQGQRIEIAELPVRRAGIYVPGGKAPYPSTVVMGAVTAGIAGVEEIAVCAPPQADGEAHPTILAACALCGVSEVYRMGGAQAIAALAHGTETVPAVDVIAGPGNAFVQEAKRQVSWSKVGIDGLAGPSELVVLAAGEGVDPEPLALDLLAQAEHGESSPLWLISPQPELLEAIVAAVQRLAAERPSAAEAELQVIAARDAEEALRMAEHIAPEHLELVGAHAEALATEVRQAGCLFVGASAATAFGDYVAGSNHVLPTGGAARFQSAISAATFRRRMARVSLPGEAAARLAPAGAALARAEGFPVHAESMERRA
jgi:histidinol dehydrogenase